MIVHSGAVCAEGQNDFHPAAIARSGRHLPAGLAVDHLPQNVSMSRVTGGFFEKMHQNPAETRWRSLSDISAELIKTCGRHDGISAFPGLLIDGNGGLHGISWSDAVIFNDGVLTGETME